MTSISRLTLALVVALFFVAAPSALAADYPAGFEERTIVAGLSEPTAMAWAPDGRMFVIEKPGRLKVVAPGGSTATTILDISGRVNSYHDRGLLGIAVDSSFASNGYVYLLYTFDRQQLTPDGSAPMVSRLDRFTVSTANVVSGETPLLGTYNTGPCPTAQNTIDCIPSDHFSHSIGSVRSAPDGTLWVGSGDGASYSTVDPLAFRTYDEKSLAGKIMHVDRNGRGLPGHPFCPTNNNLDHVCTKVWAGGFRNPFRFKLRPGGGLAVGDVGWYRREEVDLVSTTSGGKLYGWPCYEGIARTPGYEDRSECAPQYAKEGTAGAHVGPNHDYPHDSDSAVLGGPTYTGSQYPAGFQDDIFFGDYAAGFVKKLNLNAAGQVTGVDDFATGWAGTDLESTPAGDLAYASFGDGTDGTGAIIRIAYSPGNRTPVAAATATPTSGPGPLDVSFTGSASSDPDGDALSYDWDFGDGSAHSTQANPTHRYTTNGNFTARLQVSDGRGLSDSRSLTIAVGGSAPVASIDSPADRSSYRAGQAIQLQGSGTDQQDGTLPASAFRWTVRLIHGDHTHLVNQFDGTRSPSFTAQEDHDSDSHYEIVLQVTDSGGLIGTRTIRLDPQTVSFTLASTPAGAPVTYAGLSGAAPFTRSSGIGFRTTISAADRFVTGGREYVFDRWSDGGARQHDVTIPATATTLTAQYTQAATVPGLVAAFGFEETGGATVGDSSGRGNGGTLDGATRTAAGRNGRALDFDGVNDWVTVPDSPSLDLTGAMTLSAWVKSDAATKAWQTVLLKETPGTLSYGLYASGDDPLPIAWWGSSGLDVPTDRPLQAGAWTHLAVTGDGSSMRFYLNGVQVSQRSLSSQLAPSSLPLRIGGNSVWSGEFFDGVIDDVRVYDRALSATEVQADRDTAVGGTGPPPDTIAPTVSVSSPSSGATLSGSVSVSANAADNVGVTNVQFKLDGANLGAADTSSPYGTTWDTRTASNGSHTLTAVARDAAGNATTSTSVQVNVANAAPDTTPPTASISAPAAGATVANTVSVSANAADNVGVTNVQFKLDGANLGAADTSAPYGVSWDTRTASNGSHTLTAVARDAAGNATTSAGVQVTVSNSTTPPSGLVAAYGFGEASGAAVTDASGRGNNGTILGAARTASGKNGAALSFDGVDDWVTVPDSASLDLTTGATLSAWVKSDAASKAWQTVLMKEAPGTMSYGLYATADSPLATGYWGPSGLDVPNDRPLATGVWTHVAVTGDGSTLRFYLNGVQVSQRSLSGQLAPSSLPLRIGGNSVWSGEFFDGVIDDVRVYSRALGAAEIATDGNTPVG